MGQANCGKSLVVCTKPHINLSLVNCFRGFCFVLVPNTLVFKMVTVDVEVEELKIHFAVCSESVQQVCGSMGNRVPLKAWMVPAVWPVSISLFFYGSFLHTSSPLI